MRQIFTKISLSLLAGAVLMFGGSGVAAAACTNDGSAKSQVLQGVGQTGSNCKDDQVDSTIAAAVRILSYFVGVVAIIMIIMGGFKYITSGGDANNITNAKNTLLYALVGLAVAALAQVLVEFVLTAAT